MDAPVSYSEAPLVFDAMPAVKVRHYYGALSRGKVYTYARMYVLRDALELSLYNFLREPDAADEVAFVVGTQPQRCLLLTLRTGGTTLSVWEASKAGGLLAQAKQLSAPVPSYFKSDDEQGWYWGANVTLPAGALREAGVTLGPSATFSGGVLYRRSGETGFGASFETEAENPLQPRRFNRFCVVDY